MHYIKVVLLQTERMAPRRMCGVTHYPGWVLVYEPAMLGTLGLNIFQLLLRITVTKQKLLCQLHSQCLFS